MLIVFQVDVSIANIQTDLRDNSDTSLLLVLGKLFHVFKGLVQVEETLADVAHKVLAPRHIVVSFIIQLRKLIEWV